MPVEKINGVDIYYEVHGKGEPLVLMHHGMGSMKMWTNFIPVFSAEYKVIAYDRRGFGLSGKESFRNYYKSDEYTRNSVSELSILLERLGIQERVYILGQCEGGALGFHYIAQYPDRVKTIAISSTMCCSKTGMSQQQEKPQQPPESRTRPSFETAPPEFQEKLTYWHGEKYAPEFYSLFVEGGGVYETGPQPFDLRDTLAKVQCPALVLYPDRSRLFDVEQGVMMYRSLPNGELAVLPHCGHNTYEYQPEEYKKSILSFFERNS